MKSPLTLAFALLFMLACTSTPPPPPRYERGPERPRPTPLVDLRSIWRESNEEAYQDLIAQFGATSSVPPLQPGQEQRCRNVPPVGVWRDTRESHTYMLAQECGWVAAALRIAREHRAGAVCIPSDAECFKRRAREDNRRRNGARFDHKNPDCGLFLYRFREWEKGTQDWARDCTPYQIFETTELRDNPSWSTAEFRACLAPNVPGFANLAPCLTRPSDGIAEKLYDSEPQRNRELVAHIDARAERLYSQLKSNRILCGGTPRSTYLEKSEALYEWSFLADSDAGRQIERQIDERHGEGSLSAALKAAGDADNDFHSELCLAKRR